MINFKVGDHVEIAKIAFMKLLQDHFTHMKVDLTFKSEIKINNSRTSQVIMTNTWQSSLKFPLSTYIIIRELNKKNKKLTIVGVRKFTLTLEQPVFNSFLSELEVYLSDSRFKPRTFNKDVALFSSSSFNTVAFSTHMINSAQVKEIVSLDELGNIVSANKIEAKAWFKISCTGVQYFFILYNGVNWYPLDVEGDCISYFICSTSRTFDSDICLNINDESLLRSLVTRFAETLGQGKEDAEET
jgi:hypothetical protein